LYNKIYDTKIKRLQILKNQKTKIHINVEFNDFKNKDLKNIINVIYMADNELSYISNNNSIFMLITLCSNKVQYNHMRYKD